jgi:hypothetical protein
MVESAEPFAKSNVEQAEASVVAESARRGRNESIARD